MSKYTALTIGPIYPTFEKARKTRELWGGSFLFSMLMRKIIEQVDEVGMKENIILPYADQFPELETVGLYPDRLLYKGELALDVIVAKAIDGMAGLICTPWGNKESVKKFLECYLRVYYFTADLDPMEEKKGNYVDQLNLILNSLELNDKIEQNSKYWSVASFYKYLPHTDLYKNYFLKKYKNRSRSLVEIATNELSGMDGYESLIKTYIEESDKESEGKVNTDYEADFLSQLKMKVDQRVKEENEKKKENRKPITPFRNYHKYVAVVYADGDKMGKLINKMVTRESDGMSIHKVSNQLFDWAKKASDEIDEFGGMPVYAGGDDLLFFAPVVNNGENLFDLLEGINRTFTTLLHPLLEGKVGVDFDLPSLSFGVSITYYKYPLNEALGKAHDLLGRMKGKGGNGVCLKILKHSGSDYEYTMKFDKPKRVPDENSPVELNDDNRELAVFRSLMASNDFNQTMLSSTVYHLQDNVKVFDELNGDELRIRQFFINNMREFPDERRIDEETKHYLLDVERLVVLAFRDNAMTDGSGEYVNRILPVYDVLRMVKFFKGMDEIH